MLKWIVPVTKKEGVDRESFYEFWRSIHAPHVANLARPVRYCVTFFESVGSLGGPPATDDMPYDGMAELWFRDFEHFGEAFGEHRGALRSIDGFGELIEPTSDALFTTENLIVDATTPDHALKWVAFVKRGEGVTREQLFTAWTDGHSPRVANTIARTSGACLRYTTSHANQGTEGGPWDGIASLWYSDAKASAKGLPPSDEPGDPFPALIDGPASVILQGREITVVS